MGVQGTSRAERRARGLTGVEVRLSEEDRRTLERLAEGSDRSTVVRELLRAEAARRGWAQTDGTAAAE